MKRTCGFSLAEVALGVTIAVALSSVVAGAANYTMKRAKYQDLANYLKDYQNAIETYMTYSAQNPGAEQTPITCPIENAIGKYRTNQNTTYKNPFSLLPLVVNCQTADVNGGYPTNYAVANYPLATNYKGVIFYFRRSALGLGSVHSFKLWDGGNDRFFTNYALQAIDENGYPYMTVGR